ncbi:MAG: hypothetical protein HJJLKODD_02292 [Phycisphaerae bacterium]|nr:hypothetical protein [Phycisphaerae bacterium]
MSTSDKQLIEQLTPAKALALGIYGEDVAAYGYVLLSEKAPREEDREQFRDMITEEQEHRDRLQTMMDRYFPDTHYVLTPVEKELVESGVRPAQITDQGGYEQALRVAIESEGKTARFYDQMWSRMEIEQICKIFRELASEGFDHQQRLRDIATANNITA